VLSERALYMIGRILQEYYFIEQKQTETVLKDPTVRWRVD